MMHEYPHIKKRSFSLLNKPNFLGGLLMKRSLKVILATLSVVAGAAMVLVGFSYWLQKQIGEVFGDVDWDGFEEEETGIVPEIVKSEGD